MYGFILKGSNVLQRSTSATINIDRKKCKEPARGNNCTFSGFAGRLVSPLGIPFKFSTYYHIERLAIQSSLLLFVLMYADLEKGGTV